MTGVPCDTILKGQGFGSSRLHLMKMNTTQQIAWVQISCIFMNNFYNDLHARVCRLAAIASYRIALKSFGQSNTRQNYKSNLRDEIHEPRQGSCSLFSVLPGVTLIETICVQDGVANVLK